MLRFTNLRTERLSKKLDTRLYDLFEITEVINTQVYRLKLSRVYKVHLVFYVSLLKSHRLNTIKDRVTLSSSSIEIFIENDEYEKYELIEVLKSKRVRKRLKYYVR